VKVKVSITLSHDMSYMYVELLEGAGAKGCRGTGVTGVYNYPAKTLASGQ